MDDNELRVVVREVYWPGGQYLRIEVELQPDLTAEFFASDRPCLWLYEHGFVEIRPWVPWPERDINTLWTGGA